MVRDPPPNLMWRRDGFASVYSDETGGELLRRSLRFSNKHLFVNLTVPKGSLDVDLLDWDGDRLERSVAIQGDETVLHVKWKGKWIQ
jgi:hypothetical protein